ACCTAFSPLHVDAAPFATIELATLSLHDALPICTTELPLRPPVRVQTSRSIPIRWGCGAPRRSRPFLAESSDDERAKKGRLRLRSEEHTSELQSHLNLVCRLLLAKKTQRSRRRQA